MRSSFANAPEPMLAGIVEERTAKGAAAAIRSCEYAGATGIDLHLECLAPEEQNAEGVRKILKDTMLPVLALYYPGAQEEITEEERVSRLLQAVEGGVSGIDLQAYTYDRPAKAHLRPEYADAGYSFLHDDPHEIVLDERIIERQCALIEKVHSMGAEVLMSCHPKTVMKCEEVVELALLLEKRGPDILKIVTVARTEEDLAESFRTMVALKKTLHTKVVFHCAGRAGRLSRIVNPLLGGHMAFCVDGFRETSVLDQLDLRTASEIVDRMRKIMM